MKKILALLSIMLLSLALFVGCGNEAAEQPETNETEQVEQNEEAQAEAEQTEEAPAEEEAH